MCVYIDEKGKLYVQAKITLKSGIKSTYLDIILLNGLLP